METRGVFFTEEQFGYDKEQVNSYISRLMQEYQLLWQEYENTRWFLADREVRMRGGKEDGQDIRTDQSGVLHTVVFGRARNSAGARVGGSSAC